MLLLTKTGFIMQIKLEIEGIDQLIVRHLKMAGFDESEMTDELIEKVKSSISGVVDREISSRHFYTNHIRPFTSNPTEEEIFGYWN